MLELYRGAVADDHDDKPRTDARVETLCKELAGHEAQRNCETKAKALGLVVDKNQPKGRGPLAAKVQPPRPEPLYTDYTRTAANEIRVLFPRLPNPDIGIFIYPHLATRNEVPVPGYATVIPLYERVQYALPGESREIRQQKQGE